jgi:hypothetical protein
MIQPARPRELPEQTSVLRVCFYSFLASCSVGIASFVLQWLIYDDWLHETGPLRLVGTALSAVITFFFVWRWQEGIRRKAAETQQRLLIIAEMNDRIRNALQTIECITYAKDESATQSVRESVDRIDTALRGLVEEVNRSHRPNQDVAKANVVRALL